MFYVGQRVLLGSEWVTVIELWSPAAFLARDGQGRKVWYWYVGPATFTVGSESKKT